MTRLDDSATPIGRLAVNLKEAYDRQPRDELEAVEAEVSEAFKELEGKGL